MIKLKKGGQLKGRKENKRTADCQAFKSKLLEKGDLRDG
jgi:hypothetical protein